MPETLQWQVVATLGEFGRFDTVSGGGVTVTHTDYTPAGERSARKLPATNSVGDVSLSRVYVPERDRALMAWHLRYKEGLDQGRPLIVTYLNAQKVVVDTRTYPNAKPMTVDPPDGQSGGAGLAEIKVVVVVEDVAI